MAVDKPIENSMREIDPKTAPIKDVFGYLLAGVSPRPIALVSTISSDGCVNLSPFSFFNAFSANPPIVAFSPSRRLRDSSVKDTYTNIMDTKECVIQVVTYDIAQQVNLASADFDSGVNEFEKSGLTPIDSVTVKPPRVLESPFQMECKLTQMVTLGEGGASGNLAICEVLRFHLSDKIMNDGSVDLKKLDLVARMGGATYCRSSGAAVFEIAKPTGGSQIGFAGLPEFVRKSKLLTASNLSLLAGASQIPSFAEAREFVERDKPLSAASGYIVRNYLRDSDHRTWLQLARTENTMTAYEQIAKRALDDTECDSQQTEELVTLAWMTLVYAHETLAST